MVLLLLRDAETSRWFTACHRDELTAEIVLVPLTGAANQRKTSNSLQPPQCKQRCKQVWWRAARKDTGQAALSWEGEMAFRDFSPSSYEMQGALL